MPGLLEEEPKEEDTTNKKAFPHAAAAAGPNASGNAPLPKGVVLDKDGKPYATIPFSSSTLLTCRVA